MIAPPLRCLHDRIIGRGLSEIHEHIARDGELECGVCEMQPVEVIGIIRMIGRQLQAAIAVLCEDIFGDSAGFCECEGPVCDYGCCFGGVEAFK